MNKIKVGVVGVGYFGQFHAEKYAKLEGVELVGVVDVDPSRSQKIAQQYQTHPFFHHSNLFDRVHAVSIVVPTPFHYPIARDFFHRGIDVLIEKPIAATLEESEALCQLAESKGLIFQVGHLERFNGALAALEKMVQNPYLIESHRCSPFPWRETDIDVVIDLMVHDIDIVLNLVKSEIIQIDAVGIPMLTSHLDIAHAWIVFENGCRAIFNTSRVSEEKIRKTQIFQSNGILTIDYLSQKASFSRKRTPLDQEGKAEMFVEEIPAKKVDLLEEEVRSFIDCVRNRKKALISGRDGKRTLELAFRIIQKMDNIHQKNKIV